MEYVDKGTEVKIVWEDCEHWSDDITIKEILREPTALYTTWGRVLPETNTHILIVSTLGDDANIIKEATRIPLSLVRSIKILGEVK